MDLVKTGCRAFFAALLLHLGGCAAQRHTESDLGGDCRGKGYAAELRATVNGVTTTSQLMVQGPCVRIEVEGLRRSSVMLVRYDLHRAWLLIPSQQRYVAMTPADLGRQLPPFFKPGLRIERERIGEELVAGQRTVRSRARIYDQGTPYYNGMLWEEPGLSPLPVKWLDEENRVSAVWDKRRRADFPTALFEVPGEYLPLEPEAGSALKRP